MCKRADSWERLSCTIPIPVPPSIPQVPKVFPVLPSLCVSISENKCILPPHLSSFTCLCVAFQSPSICRDIHLTSVLGAWAHILNFFCFLYFWHQKEFHGRVQIAETNNLFCFEGLFQSSLVRFFLKKKTLLAAGNLGQKKGFSSAAGMSPKPHGDI